MSNSTFTLLTAGEVERLFTPEMAVHSQRAAFLALASGEAQLPARLVLEGEEGSSAFCYAAKLSSSAASVCKFGSIVPANSSRGIPTIAALITVLDAMTGQPQAIMDGTAITMRRTAAASTVAAQALRTPGPGALAVIGSGVQAESHLRALPAACEFTEIRIFGVQRDKVDALVERVSPDIEAPLHATDSAGEAVRGATVVLTVTTSPTPVLESAWIEPGTTVISVGSHTADHEELPQDLVARCDQIVVDHVDTALEHAGPIVRAVAEGTISHDDLVGLGDVLAGKHPGRRSDDDIVYYNTVGVGIQDAAAAQAVIAAAEEAGIGTPISLS